MYSTPAPTVCASVAAGRVGGWGMPVYWGTKLNKFEQVSSLGHQMSLVVFRTRVSTGGFLYSEINVEHIGEIPVQCQWGPSWTSLNLYERISWMVNGVLVWGLSPFWRPPVNRMTDRQTWLKTLPSALRCRAVNICWPAYKKTGIFPKRYSIWCRRKTLGQGFRNPQGVIINLG